MSDGLLVHCPDAPLSLIKVKVQHGTWEAALDITVTTSADGSSWALTDLLGRSMGRIIQRSASAFVIEPDGGAVETMGAIVKEEYASLDQALAKIEEHTRGVCHHAPGSEH